MSTIRIPQNDEGGRLDVCLARLAPDHSRARWQALIADGRVQLNGTIVVKPRTAVAAGDAIDYVIPAPTPTRLVPEDRPIDVVFEDDEMLVLNKPAGWVVHPGPGHEKGTLVHALLHHCPDLKGIGGEVRPGIVHRLDQDTSGLLVVAKSELAHRRLVEMFKERSVKKEYVAIVFGRPEPERGVIRTLIGRSDSNRQKMSAKAEHGRMAVTHYEVVETNGQISLVRIRIETGRTHQIRVHMTHIGCAIVGDAMYGARKQESKALGATRQMLHAETLALLHPITGQDLEFFAPMPADMRKIVAAILAGRLPGGSSKEDLK
ncbi:MAG: RluA family pseudouridine synthase [Verrucomicrobia bacterium]|nr:RluA family pseudouridine synthase [Verrucomicrobiota bacterium]